MRSFVFGDRVNYPMLNMLNVMFGGALHILPRRNFARFLLGLFLLYTLVMRNAYTGSLYQFLRTSEENQIPRNMKEMNAGDYSFMALEALSEFINNFPRLASKTRIVNTTEVEDIRSLLLKDETKLALLASEDHVAYWNKKSFPRHSFAFCPERASAINIVIYMHKTSCLTPEFSRQILNFNSIGLVEIFKQDYIDPNFMSQWSSFSSEPKRFTLKELEGAFLLLAIGIFASILSWFSEILFKFASDMRMRDRYHHR